MFGDRRRVTLAPRPHCRQCGTGMACPAVHLEGSVLRRQLTKRSSSSLLKPEGIWMKGCQSGGPASSTQTLCPPSPVGRFASTPPADPAPMTM